MVTITFYVGEVYLRIPTRNRWEPKLGYFQGTHDKGVGGCRGHTRENARNLGFCCECNLCSLRRTWKIYRIREKQKQVTWIPAIQREALLTLWRIPFFFFPCFFREFFLEGSPGVLPWLKISCTFQSMWRGIKNEYAQHREPSVFCLKPDSEPDSSSFCSML